MITYDHRSVLDDSWKEDGEHLDWSMTDLLTASSASSSLHMFTVQKLNTTRVKSPTHLVTRGNCPKLSPCSYTMITCDSFDTLATPFEDFFSEKISKIRDRGGRKVGTYG
ncbi:hypothetical protein LSAT2_023315 [Lamellibrachia satsuma]|nr:hypothetical protein LSAT2_023315 [Lamellibrachia satsuma]